MSAEIDWLTRSLQEVRQLLQQLAPEPEPYSGEWLMQQSLRERESVLQSDLSTAVLQTGRPVLTCAFDGPPVREHTIYLSFLAAAMNYLQAAVEAVAQALYGEVTTHGPIPDGIRASSRLRLAGLSEGSFGVVLVGDDQPVQRSLFTDEIELTLLERSVGRVLVVVEAVGQDDPDTAVIEAVADLGQRAVTDLGRLAASLLEGGASTRFTWESPRVQRQEVVLRQHGAGSLVKLLSDIEEDVVEEEFVGRLVGARLLRNQFDLLLSDNTVITGRTSPTAREKMPLFFDRQCIAKTERTVAKSRAGRRSTEKYLLTDLIQLP